MTEHTGDGQPEYPRPFLSVQDISGSRSPQDRQKAGNPLHSQTWELAGHRRDRAECHDAPVPLPEDWGHKSASVGTERMGERPQRKYRLYPMALYHR